MPTPIQETLKLSRLVPIGFLAVIVLRLLAAGCGSN
jgi:hypothetical protein